VEGVIILADILGAYGVKQQEAVKS
jgi:hypothetical protein